MRIGPSPQCAHSTVPHSDLQLAAFAQCRCWLIGPTPAIAAVGLAGLWPTQAMLVFTSLGTPAD